MLGVERQRPEKLDFGRGEELRLQSREPSVYAEIMKASRFLRIFSSLFLAGCASVENAPRVPANVITPVQIKIPTRDEILGPNRAVQLVKSRSKNGYIYRNVSAAFPDPGKNMLLKDRAIPKDQVRGALDHSPWRLKVYENSEHIAENKARFSSGNKAFYSTPLTQREAALLLNQSPRKEVTEPFYQTETFGQDDLFEPNNFSDQAFDLSDAEDRWLSLLGPKDVRTEGVQWDEDWYKIFVSSQYRRLMLDLRFQNYLGDIDMKLFDAKGNLVSASQGNGDDEFIHLVLEKGGTYFVQIYGSNRGNRYDFKYSTYFTGGGDDEYEDNDRLSQAYDLRRFEGKWLSQIDGEAVAADDDYYLIRVPAGRLRLQVDLRVDVDKGDVDMRLMTPQGQTIASSANIGNDDFIDFTVPKAGNYYLKVYPFSPQSTFNQYDLKWTTLSPSQNETGRSPAKTGKNPAAVR